jgi:hypothetical protein
LHYCSNSPFDDAMMHALPPHQHDHDSPHHPAVHPVAKPTRSLSVLAWPAWRRVLAVLPLVLALWLAVGWANMGASPW